MGLLPKDVQDQVRELFRERLVNPVKIYHFTQALNCQYCAETETLLREVADLSDLIELEVYNFAVDKEKAEELKVDKVPATIIAPAENSRYNIRFFGIPSGYEFTSLIEDIVHVSRGESELSPQTVEFLKGIQRPLHVQVFVTPTCPYCPRMVLLAHKAALENKNILADMIEAVEFPELSNRYGVYAVPKTVINDRVEFEGAVPEEMFVEYLRQALEQEEG